MSERSETHSKLDAEPGVDHGDHAVASQLRPSVGRAPAQGCGLAPGRRGRSAVSSPRGTEELGFFSDEGVWGQEEEQKRGTGEGVSLQSLSRGHCAFNACCSQGRGRRRRGESENSRHLVPLGAGRIMSCRAAPEPEPCGAAGSPACLSLWLKGQEARVQSLPSSSLDVGPSHVNSPGCPSLYSSPAPRRSSAAFPSMAPLWQQLQPWGFCPPLALPQAPLGEAWSPGWRAGQLLPVFSAPRSQSQGFWSPPVPCPVFSGRMV